MPAARRARTMVRGPGLQPFRRTINGEPIAGRSDKVTRTVRQDADRAAFKLRRASFKGRGLQPEFQEVSWDKLRDAAYEDRGA